MTVDEPEVLGGLLVAWGVAYLFSCVTLWRVVRVVDGDTFEASRLFRRIRVRINGIDAPETGQSHGEESKRELERALSWCRVRLVAKGQHMDRSVCEVLTFSVLRGFRPLSERLVRVGAAHVDERFTEDRPELRRAQAWALLKRRGVWAAKKVVSPRNWRMRRL